jgi:hypothetical protein
VFAPSVRNWSLACVKVARFPGGAMATGFPSNSEQERAMAREQEMRSASGSGALVTSCHSTAKET